MKEDRAVMGLPEPDEDDACSEHLGRGTPAPDMLTVKDFLRFYIATSKSQIDKERPTADSICTIAEWFFAGFTRVTGTDTNADDRSEVYYVGRFLSLTPSTHLNPGNRPAHIASVDST